MLVKESHVRFRCRRTAQMGFAGLGQEQGFPSGCSLLPAAEILAHEHLRYGNGKAPCPHRDP